MPSSHVVRAKVDEKSFKNRRKPIPNRRKIDLGPFWAPKAASVTPPDALGTVFGRPNVALRPIWGRPGHAKSGQEPSKSAPAPPQGRSKNLPVSRPSACGAPSAVERAFGLIFHRFCVVTWKLRCAFRISFSGALLTSDELSTARTHTAKTLENRGVSTSKIEPGGVRATQNRVRAALFKRKSALEVPPGLPKILKSVRTSYFERERASQCPRGASGPPGIPKENFRIDN